MTGIRGNYAEVGCLAQGWLLLESDDAPEVWLVLKEAVIRRAVGGSAVMRAQLRRLIEASRLPKTCLIGV